MDHGSHRETARSHFQPLEVAPTPSSPGSAEASSGFDQTQALLLPSAGSEDPGGCLKFSLGPRWSLLLCGVHLKTGSPWVTQ